MLLNPLIIFARRLTRGATWKPSLTTLTDAHGHCVRKWHSSVAGSSEKEDFETGFFEKGQPSDETLPGFFCQRAGIIFFV